MNYVDRNLRKGETVIVKAKKSFWFIVAGIIKAAIPIILGSLIETELSKSSTSTTISTTSPSMSFSSTLGYLKIFYIVVGVVILLYHILVILTTHLAVTDKRIIGKVGILRIETMDVPIEKVDNCGFDAKFWGRIFRYYTVTVMSASGKYKFHAIGNAQIFKDKTTDAIDSRQEYLRKAQASEIANAMSGKKAL